MMGAVDPRDLHADGGLAPAEQVAAGSILGGKYRLISEIGRGGMGSVWRAEHLTWEAPVALKIMNRNITARPEAVARFEREVRLAAGLRSPHVVQVLDHGVDEATRTPFIVMELMEGESLARRLSRFGSLGPGETFHIFSQLVRALTRAHAAGIVHRDLKPDNVFLVRNDEEYLTKVLDFGVAKWTAPDILESGLTRPGSVVGTPFYMSPEQIQGSREIDHRVDLWALAAIACECLTGHRAFQARDFAQLAVMLLGNQGRSLPSSLGPVPPGFDAWFLRATDPDISRRFQTAREMAQTLAPICDVPPSNLGSDAHAPHRTALQTRHDAPSMAAVSNTAPPSILMHPALWQRPMAKLAGVTVVVTLIATGVVAFWLGRRSPQAMPGTTAPSLTTSVPARQPPSAAGPGVRPGIRPIAADEPVRPPLPVRPEPTSGVGLEGSNLSADPSGPGNGAPSDDFDPDEAQKRVRAALLARPKPQKPRSKPGSSNPVSSNPVSAKPSHVTAPSPRRVQETLEPSRAPSPPPENPEPKPRLVDGRRIRTTL
jgi:eukaryotic-like serine/threonine-protein kinase